MSSFLNMVAKKSHAYEVVVLQITIYCFDLDIFFTKSDNAKPSRTDN